jgi:hypothetical protein
MELDECAGCSDFAARAAELRTGEVAENIVQCRTSDDSKGVDLLVSCRHDADDGLYFHNPARAGNSSRGCASGADNDAERHDGKRLDADAALLPAPDPVAIPRRDGRSSLARRHY